MAQRWPESEQPTTAICIRDACIELATADCGYVDFRGERCRTSWCAEHQETVEGVGYCVRHAGLVRAIVKSKFPNYRPRLDTRAPSLANWIGDALDAGVRTSMAKAAGAAAKRVVSGALMPSDDPDDDETPRWQRSWHLKTKRVEWVVSVAVDEITEETVRIKVNGEVVAQTVPPWITYRPRRPLTEQEGRELRDTFYDWVRARIEAGLKAAMAAV